MRNVLIAFIYLIFALGVLWPRPLAAHASLQRSTPPTNSAAPTAPPEIRLWFTEPLEARFSEIQVHNSSGALVTTAASQVEPTDTKQLVLRLEPLPEGVYTVVWWVVSAADGHHTAGSFPFSVGTVAAEQMSTVTAVETIPWPATWVRWFNLLGFALAVGSLAFLRLVWQPVTAESAPVGERTLQQAIWLGWLLLGLGGGLMLLLQTATSTGGTLASAWKDPALNAIINETRFGSLWMARMSLWVLMGLMLGLANLDRLTHWIALVVGLLILATHSLYSHSAAAPMPWPAIANDWFHLLMTALWLGGLVQFFLLIGVVRRVVPESTELVARFTMSFSNYARITMAGLVISGLYSGWLHVGSWPGLQETLYGRVLLVKLACFLPLLTLAGINLVLTQQRLLTRQAVWVGRLRGLIGAEIALVLGVLLAVGVMTSISPARITLAERAQQALATTSQPELAPIFAMSMFRENNLHVQMTIAPGWAGENTFAIALSTLNEQDPSKEEPINDASLIRLRFEHQTEDLGRSELRVTEGQNGLYTVQGANLSVPGDWLIRMTIQRPNQFDTVVDFAPPVPAPPIDTTIPQQTQLIALLAAGLAALVLGGYFIGQTGLPPRSLLSLLPTGLALLGLIFLGTAALV